MLKQFMLGLLLIAAPITSGIYAENNSSINLKGMEARRCQEQRTHGTSSQNDAALAFFYLSPTDVVAPNTIADGAPVLFRNDRFTVKSEGINVTNSLVGNNVINSPSGTIVFSDSGIYSIIYSIYASSESLLISDFFTMELQLNGASVAGSRFTSTLPANTAVLPLTFDSQELVGQVLTYIPAGGSLSLVNVSGFPIVTGTDNLGNLVSISIHKIADTIR